jgi:hypothetical protein
VMGKSRLGHTVRGFYMTNHDECCQVIDGQHVLALPVAVEPEDHSNLPGAFPENDLEDGQCRTTVARNRPKCRIWCRTQCRKWCRTHCHGCRCRIWRCGIRFF